MTAWRKVVRWGLAGAAACELALIVCAVGGARAAPAAWPAVGSTVAALMTGATALLLLDHRRHRCGGLHRRAAFLAATAHNVPTPVRKLISHKITLATSFVRWTTRRGPHGVPDGAYPVPYAPAQTATLYGLLFVCIVETVALACLIPWPVVHTATLVLDIGGCYFLLALHASCVVRART